VKNRILRFSEILKASQEHPAILKGCLVDTSILFAASYDADEFNSRAIEVFEFLGELQIPVYTNVNIRAEFIDQHRRVMIPEGLASMFSQYGKTLSSFLYAKLQVINTEMTEARRTGRPYKFNEEKIKTWRRLLRNYKLNRIDGWDQFCVDYLQGSIEQVWGETCDALKVNFLSLRGSDQSDWISDDVTWEGMSTLVGRYGIGSFDAMIINLFMGSKFTAILTADREFAYVIDKIGKADKFVIVPDRLDL